MTISTYTGNNYNLQIIPDFVADTLAEVQAALATYEGKYIQITDQSGDIFFVLRQGGSLILDPAYGSNYSIATPTSGGGSVQEVFVEPTNPTVGYPAINFKNVGGDLYELWVNIP